MTFTGALSSNYPSPVDVVAACVTEDTPKYLGQTLRLVQSIRWFGGELAKARIVVGAVEHIDPRARRALEALDAQVHVVARFHPGSWSGNRLQIFDVLRGARESHYLMLDCDTLVVRDPLPLLKRDVFHAKIAPLPTVTHEVFERLFARFGLPLPPRTHVTGYTGTPTIPYFNAGVISISADLAERLAPEWRRYNAILASQPELVAPCEHHLHQAALAIALAATGIPTEEMGAELNFQLNATHLPAPPGYAEIDPAIIHYHQLVDDDGILLPTPFPNAQARIDRFHDRQREEHARAIRRTSIATKKQIAVIGMHRSGTSLVARLINAMGAYAGEEHEMPPPDVFNPTGYWERRDVWALDEDILAALDATWSEPTGADLSKLSDEARRAFVDRARSIVRALDTHGTWMIKDPRLGILFPIWREAFDDSICVLVWREPAAVARSLAQRDDLPIAIALALWEEYTRAMLASTIGLTRTLVSYDDLIADPIVTTATLNRTLDLELPVTPIIDPSLDRHRGDDEGLLNQQQSELRDALRSGAALEWSVVPPSHSQTRSLLDRFSRDQREIAALRESTQQRDQLLDAVFDSRSWRLGFGLTRALRKVVPSSEPTAIDRRASLRKKK